MRYFEDFAVGTVHSSQTAYLMTEQEIVDFGTRWDPQPFHVDRKAAEDSIFGGLVASSVQLFAIYVWFSNQTGEETAAVSALGFDQMRLHAPARPGDRLSFAATCIEARPSQSRPECGVISSDCQLRNQRNEMVLSVRCAFLVACRDTAGAGGDS